MARGVTDANVANRDAEGGVRPPVAARISLQLNGSEAIADGEGGDVGGAAALRIGF